MNQLTQPQAFTTLADLGVVASYCRCEGKAHRLIDEMAVDAGAWPVGVDFETTPLPSETARLAALDKDLAVAEGNLRALRLCRALPARIGEKKREVGRLKAAINYISSASLDPHRSSIRLLQLYGGRARAAVIDLHRAGASVLDRLNGIRLVAHNAQFELSFLHHYGVEPDEMHCTMQAAALLDGTDRRRLEIVAANRLGVSLDKTLQASNWGAPNLTAAQIEYAALDAVVCFKLGRIMLPQLGPSSAAYAIQMRAIPAVVRMQHRGFHIDTAAHGQLLDVLRQEMDAAIDNYAAAAAAASLDAKLQVLPSTPGGKRELLEALLDGDELANWQRTPKSGELSTRRAELNRAAHNPPIRELVKASKIGKLLETFGENWLAHVSPVTGRIHAAYRVAGAASGRATCAAPNVQQIPKDKRFRELFVAPAGCLLVCADYASMELRAAAHISGDRDMTAAFVRGDDLHGLTAARVTGKNPADVTREERNSAKPVNFGSIYGQGARGLAASAWENYGIVLTVQEAEQWQQGFNAAFPGFGRWRTSHYQRVERERTIVIGREAAQGIGRIFQTSWLPSSRSAYTRSCNYPIQGACADAAMLALARIDADLFDAAIDGGPVAWLHDEIVIEVAEADAEEARRLLAAAMTDAFAETFPGAPLRGLVEAHIGLNWADANEKPGSIRGPTQ